MMRQGYKRILMIGMVLLLLFSTMTGCNGREEATTPAATTPAVTTPAPPTEAELKKQQLLDLWQSVVVENNTEVNMISNIQPATSSMWYPPVKEAVAIQEILAYLKSLAPTFTNVQKVDDLPYCGYSGYAFFEHIPSPSSSSYSRSNTEPYFLEPYFLLSATEDGVLKIADSALQWELCTAPGAVDKSAFNRFMHGYFHI